MYSKENNFELFLFDTIEKHAEKIRKDTPEKPFFENSSSWFLSCQKQTNDYFILFERNNPSILLIGFISYGWLRRGLTLISNKPIENTKQIWKFIFDFADRNAIASISIEAYGNKTENWKIPEDGNGWKCLKEMNSECYVIDLRKKSGLSKNHKRNIKKAKKINCEIIEPSAKSNSDVAISLSRLCTISYARHSDRGETIQSPRFLKNITQLLKNQYSRVFQAKCDNKIMASNLIIQIGDSAYYDSGGTTSEGMNNGVSYYLMSRIIEVLQKCGIVFFSLGVANRPGLKDLNWDSGRFLCKYAGLPCGGKTNSHIF